MKAINISLFDYNTGNFIGTSAVMKEILDNNNFCLIVIDDPDIRQRFDSALPAWTQSDTVVHYHMFHDTEEDGKDCFTITMSDQISNLIKHAKENNMDLVVSCIAGLSRSGAVVQAAIDYGFEDTLKVRTPNNRVKNMIKDSLGISINAATSAFN